MFKFHLINAASNPIYKDLKIFIKNGENKNFNDLFCVAGWKNNLTALQSNWLPHSVFIGLKVNPKIVTQIKILTKNQKIRWIQLSESLTNQANDIGNGNDIFFYYPKKTLVQPSFIFNEHYNYILCDNVQDPNNFGTIMRNAAAFNIAGVFSLNGTNLWNPRLVRASAGTIFTLPVSVIDDWNNFVKVYQQKKIKLIVTTNDANTTPLVSLANKKGLMIAFGNEGHGLSERVLKAADAKTWISINPKVESLNVAATSAIVLYQLNQKIN
ncbi:TrmH family RNA methyltransferase [[Mycoplasma] testudinis]|uniref:TrmH family RNA methyltransferase n=1 Tax=[Mycoplasma] testudinis TaxID=33924 RepID=UPI000482FD23|nr:RNA methyltransferase [[Mycoplasma] testudinis]